MGLQLFDTETAAIELTIRLTLAVLLGGALGLEREFKNHSAGLRTHMMVSLAAAAFTLLGTEFIAASRDTENLVQIDPLRVIEAVIAGVAFLGAGAIIRGRDGVKGLTTGASLWVSGSIGVACGGGFLMIALPVTVAALIILAVLQIFETRVKPDKSGE